MATYKPYSVIVVPFPFSERYAQKRRPALVLSQSKHQKATGHITLAMITTAKRTQWHDDFEIKSLKPAGLSVPSIVRQKIFTLDSSLVIREIGYLSQTDCKQVKQRTLQHLAVN